MSVRCESEDGVPAVAALQILAVHLVALCRPILLSDGAMCHLRFLLSPCCRRI